MRRHVQLSCLILIYLNLQVFHQIKIFTYLKFERFLENYFVAMTLGNGNTEISWTSGLEKYRIRNDE